MRSRTQRILARSSEVKTRLCLVGVPVKLCRITVMLIHVLAQILRILDLQGKVLDPKVGVETSTAPKARCPISTPHWSSCVWLLHYPIRAIDFSTPLHCRCAVFETAKECPWPVTHHVVSASQPPVPTVWILQTWSR